MVITLTVTTAKVNLVSVLSKELFDLALNRLHSSILVDGQDCRR